MLSPMQFFTFYLKAIFNVLGSINTVNRVSVRLVFEFDCDFGRLMNLCNNRQNNLFEIKARLKNALENHITLVRKVLIFQKKKSTNSGLASDSMHMEYFFIHFLLFYGI